jgi:predicted DNA-binding WGR domain protein
MNRSDVTDSYLSLDGPAPWWDTFAMISEPYQTYIERSDCARNMARFYAMSIDLTLFGETCLTRRWGRIGTSGQSMTHHFEREQDAVALFLDLLRHKRNRGYVAVRARSAPLTL